MVNGGGGVAAFVSIGFVAVASLPDPFTGEPTNVLLAVGPGAGIASILRSVVDSVARTHGSRNLYGIPSW